MIHTQSDAQGIPMKSDRGSEISLYYKLSLQDGTVVDEVSSGEPLTFVVGDGTFPAGVDQLFYGLQAGDSKQDTVTPDNGWGYPDPGNIQYLLESDFPDAQMLTPGNIIEFTLPNDEALPGTILAVEDERIKVDFNPPLAGHAVTIDVTVVEVKAGT
ncbi:MAG TPA: peptidylprolyl isomerase [Gammaproteobacteria bacterium]|nr:peptidylprolyl isomerase [Gammaproteobacteria bacterium]